METFINELLIPCVIGVFSVFFVWLQHKVLKKDKNTREIRKIQLNDIYGPLWKLQKKMEFSDDSELQSEYKEKLLDAFEQYHIYLDIELVKSILKIRNSEEPEILNEIKKIIDTNYELLVNYFEYQIFAINQEKEVWVTVGESLTCMIGIWIMKLITMSLGRNIWFDMFVIMLGVIGLWRMIQCVIKCLKYSK